VHKIYNTSKVAKYLPTKTTKVAKHPLEGTTRRQWQSIRQNKQRQQSIRQTI
jgi:hypothetical protein